jgi:phospholipid/cholesterol/gamma-HCH transport system ATP-binding protein
MLVKLIEFIGAVIEKHVERMGRLTLLFFSILKGIVRPPFEAGNIVKQMLEIGVNSLPVVLVTAVFTGMVLALQSYTGFKRFGAEGFVGTVVALSMTRELGPVLSALIVTGRAGAAMAAELGTMRVTEQIDALEAMATNPIKYLIVPRFITGMIMLPALTVVSDIVGIAGGYLVNVILLGSNAKSYMRSTWDFLQFQDIYSGLIKACFFGAAFRCRLFINDHTYIRLFFVFVAISMIELRDIHKYFEGNHVLRGASLKVEKGESLVVIGGSGSGKSVLLKHIIGLLKPDRGTVLVNSTDLSLIDEDRLNEIRKKFGMLFQSSALFDSMKVWENVGFGLKRHTRMSDSEIKEVAVQKLKTVGLVGIENEMPSELSGGMRKRVGLARAIAMEPEIILYDEPTTGLDPIMADAINELIIKMRERLNVTSVTITHDIKSAYKIADTIAMLYNGVIIARDSPEGIENTAHPVVRQFIEGRAEGPILLEGIDK